MENKIYFKENGSYWKASFLEDNYPESPRRIEEPAGKMVFKERKDYSLGDEQTEDFAEFFASQLPAGKCFVDGKITVRIPPLDQAIENDALSRYVAGNEQEHHFDAALFEQDMDAILSRIKDELGESVCDDLSGGIPLDPDMRLTDRYEIEFKTAAFLGSADAFDASGKIKEKIAEALSENFGMTGRDCFEKEILKSETDELTESQLYDRWAASKLAVLPIDLYIHSGITCHEASARKTLRANNDRDDGHIYNDGFVYIDKDDEDFLAGWDKDKISDKDYMKEQAERLLRGEIKEYASYLEGDVHVLLLEEFDKEKLDWTYSEREGPYYGSSLPEVLKDHGFSLNEILSEKDAGKLRETVTEEFRKATWDKYLSNVRDALPEFDNKVEYASGAVLYAMKKNDSQGLARKALGEYMNQNGCTSKEKTIAFLNEALGISGKGQEKSAVIPVNDKSIECVWSKVRNPERSDNGGCDRMLLIDYEKKNFALLTGVSYATSNPSDTYYKKTELLKSGKAVERKAEELLKAGFKNTRVSSDYLEQYRKNDKWIEKYILKERVR